jgi:hypothetical protein
MPLEIFSLLKRILQAKRPFELSGIHDEWAGMTLASSQNSALRPTWLVAFCTLEPRCLSTEEKIPLSTCWTHFYTLIFLHTYGRFLRVCTAGFRIDARVVASGANRYMIHYDPDAAEPDTYDLLWRPNANVRT